jgi:hypothetical protein
VEPKSKINGGLCREYALSSHNLRIFKCEDLRRSWRGTLKQPLLSLQNTMLFWQKIKIHKSLSKILVILYYTMKTAEGRVKQWQRLAARNIVGYTPGVETISVWVISDCLACTLQFCKIICHTAFSFMFILNL